MIIRCANFKSSDLYIPSKYLPIDLFLAIKITTIQLIIKEDNDKISIETIDT
jgi:hypothetical protein